jgi:uncharacterized protein YuzE
VQGTYSEQADAVYLYLVDEIRPDESKRQAPIEAEGLKAMVVLDFDEDDRILGIEIIGARGSLRPETIANLRRIG